MKDKEKANLYLKNYEEYLKENYEEICANEFLTESEKKIVLLYMNRGLKRKIFIWITNKKKLFFNKTI